MGRATAATPFSGWLRQELDSRGWGVRTLARRMNSGQPEVARRALNRYLYEGGLPSDPMRQAIARALGVSADEMPAGDDAEEPG